MQFTRHPLLAALLSSVGALLAACSVPLRAPPPVAQPAPVPPAVPLPAAPGVPGASLPTTPGTPPAAAVPPVAAQPAASLAANALAYRRDAAAHLYALNAARIYKGMLRPNLYAIGVVDVDIDRQGRVTRIEWRRAPTHAPEVIDEIERTIRAAAPYPVPQRLGRVTYRDIWLWDESGKFQLDTLTEGQM